MPKKRAIDLDQFFSPTATNDDLAFLIGAEPAETAERAAARGLPLQHIPTARIAPDPQQLRHLPHPAELQRLADEGDRAAAAVVDGLRELGQSMAEHGQIQPVIVYPDRDPSDSRITHRLLNGQRRWSAAVLLGLPEVWAVEVAAPSDTTRLLHQFEENERREGFSDMERAWALTALKEALQREAGGEVPWGVIEEQLQLSPQRRQDLLRLLRFAPAGQAIINRYGWSEWTLRPIHMAISSGALERDAATDMLRALAESPDVNATVVGALVDAYRAYGAPSTEPKELREASAEAPRAAPESTAELVQRMARVRRGVDQLRYKIADRERQTSAKWQAEAERLRHSLEELLVLLDRS
jgi:ParB/RepB/Spo0J family partition protein